MTIQMTTLPNGLRIVTDRIDGVLTASVGIWVGVGTRHETHPINGVSHFLEHMAFKGTTTRTAIDIAEQVESVGAYLNAYTGREVTAYYARCLKDDVPLMVDILSDILQNSTFDADEFKREQGVILQEIGLYNDTPDEIVFDYFQEACFPNQPMGWPTLGTEEKIKAMTPDIVRQYMKDHYCLDRMVFSASGAVDHEVIVDLVSKSLTTLPSTLQRDEAPAVYHGSTFLLDKDLEQAHIIFGFESVPYSHKDYYPLTLYSMMMGGGLSSRLFQEIREKRGLVYTIQSSLATFKNAGLFYVYAGTGAEELQELVTVVQHELEKSVNGFSDHEINRARAQLKAGLLMGLESTSNRCERNANQMLMHGHLISAEDICAKLDRITNGDIMEAAKRVLETPRTITAYGPLDHLPKLL